MRSPLETKCISPLSLERSLPTIYRSQPKGVFLSERTQSTCTGRDQNSLNFIRYPTVETSFSLQGIGYPVRMGFKVGSVALISVRIWQVSHSFSFSFSLGCLRELLATVYQELPGVLSALGGTPVGPPLGIDIKEFAQDL